MMQIISRLFVTGALLSLIACGGGGGSTPAPTPDVAPPTVSSTSPADAATDVARDGVVSATFNEDIFATTVDATSFTLANSASVSGSVSFDGNTNIATFTPSTDLPRLTSHTATLSTAITDLAGNALAADYNWSFTTADGAWKSATLIETDDAGSAVVPQIAFDSNGNALVIWQQDDGIRNNIWSNRYVASTGWGAAALIETDNAGSAGGPQITIDSNGNALAVWTQSDGTRNNIWSNRYVASTGLWGSAALIETDDAGSAVAPQIAFDSNGNALAAWYQTDGIRYNIWSNRYVAGTGWGTATLIEEDDGGDAWNPQIAIDSNGNALAVWQQGNGTRDDIWSNRYVVGTGWGIAALIETDDTASAQFPRITIDSNDNALAVWQQSDGTRINIWSNRYVAGTGWGTAALIEADDAGDATSPQIAIDSNGNALAVWQQHDGTRYNIWSNRYVAGTGWGTAALIEADAYVPQIAIDSNGNALSVWYQWDGTRNNVWSNRYVAGTGWGAAELIETDNAVGQGPQIWGPQIAIDSNGNALAVWYQFDGLRYNIYSNRFE